MVRVCLISPVSPRESSSRYGGCTPFLFGGIPEDSFITSPGLPIFRETPRGDDAVTGRLHRLLATRLDREVVQISDTDQYLEVA